MEQRYIDRFHTKYSPEALTGCFIWTGAAGYDNYGRYLVHGKTMLAHRFSALIHGLDMSKPEVRHTCHNTLCVNPAHLTTGTHQDNMDDKVKAGRQSRLPGAANGRYNPLLHINKN